MTTAYVYDPIYLEHDLPGHPEHAGRLRHILQVLQKEGMLEKLEQLVPRAATIEDQNLRHSYLENVLAHREIVTLWEETSHQ